MKGQECAGTGEEGHLIIFTRARSAHEEKKRREKEGRKKERLSQADRRFRNYILKKLVGLRKMICHHVHAIRQDDEYGAYG